MMVLLIGTFFLYYDQHPDPLPGQFIFLRDIYFRKATSSIFVPRHQFKSNEPQNFVRDLTIDSKQNKFYVAMAKKVGRVGA